MAVAYCEIPLSGKKAAGMTALVDIEKYPQVIGHRWHLLQSPRRGRDNGPYARTYIRTETGLRAISMHTMLTGLPRVDHQNGNGLDNRSGNLRDGTGLRNHWNRRPDSIGHTSRFKGVGWDPQMKSWRARITVNGKTRTIRHGSEEDCARAYNAAALEAFGEYAYLNEIA